MWILKKISMGKEEHDQHKTFLICLRFSPWSLTFEGSLIKHPESN